MGEMMCSRMCSWCGEMNSVWRKWCLNCGHAAHLPRMDCECPRCGGLGEEGPLPESICDDGSIAIYREDE